MSRLRGMGLFLALGLVLAACSERTGDTAIDDRPPVVAVEQAIPSAQGVNGFSTRRFVGRVAAVSTVDISFEVGGKLTELPVREGDIAPAGSLLAALDPKDYAIALDKAEAAARLASRDLQRKQELASRGNVSEAALDQAETENSLRQAELENARRNLNQTRIEAPFDALVSRRLVDPQTNVQPGTPVLRIQDVSELRVEISVPEDLMRGPRDADLFDVTAIVSGTDGQTYRFPLEFRENNTEPDPVTQTFTVTFAMPRPEQPTILPGMTFTVEVTPRIEISGAVVSVPVSAVVTRPDGTTIVWIVETDEETGKSTTSLREVEVGEIHDGRLTILSGLRPGETVVAAGAHLVRDGMTVRPLNNS